MLYRKRIGYAMANIEKSSHRSAQIMNYYGTPQSQSASFPDKNRKVLNGGYIAFTCREKIVNMIVMPSGTILSPILLNLFHLLK